MIAKERMRELTEAKEQCPYGRYITVGSRECINCKFNRIVTTDCLAHITAIRCEGNPKEVRQHIKRMKGLQKLEQDGEE